MIIREKDLGKVYFIIHALVEIVCFAVLYDKYGLGVSFVVAMLFDYFAFVPQALIGELNYRFRRWDIGTIGTILMSVGIFVSSASNRTTALVGICILALGNAMLHEAGAVATITCSNGKLFPSALFVAGGSFGLVIGQLLGGIGVNRFLLLGLMVIIEILVLLTNKYWLKDVELPVFELVDDKYGKWSIFVVAFVVTAVRSFQGYAIPMSWKKEIWQTVLLFFIMGLGKAAGGYFADKFGAKKVAVWATVASIPFLLLGNSVMVVSMIGVCVFSFTMSITFGMLLSIIKGNPGLAFGVTTLALFTGIVPVLFYGTFGNVINGILVAVFSIGCAICLHKTLR